MKESFAIKEPIKEPVGLILSVLFVMLIVFSFGVIVGSENLQSVKQDKQICEYQLKRQSEKE